MEFLAMIGVSLPDVVMFSVCMIFGAVGSFFNSMVIINKAMKTPFTEVICDDCGHKRTYSIDGADVFWFFARMLVGAGIGLAVSLFFWGSLNSNGFTTAKIMLISFVLGFYAQNVIDFMDKKVNKTLAES